MCRDTDRRDHRNRSRHRRAFAGIKQGFLGGLKQIFGGNIEAFAQVCDQARRDAYQRMVAHAEDKEADAIIGMRYDATEFAQATTEVLAYGTAVKLERG